MERREREKEKNEKRSGDRVGEKTVTAGGTERIRRQQKRTRESSELSERRHIGHKRSGSMCRQYVRQL